MKAKPTDESKQRNEKENEIASCPFITSTYETSI